MFSTVARSALVATRTLAPAARINAVAIREFAQFTGK